MFELEKLDEIACPLNAFPFNPPPVTLFFGEKFPVAETAVKEPLFRSATARMSKAWILGAQKIAFACGVLSSRVWKNLWGLTVTDFYG